MDTGLELMRQYFNSGVTRSYAFRRQQLLRLREALQQQDAAIGQALYADLRKNPEETYATETAMVLAEIRVALKKLKKWMRPSRVPTNLVNLPSTGKLYRDPLGVVLIIAPWNYPLQLLLAPLVGAIAAGNCVVLKPSELAPATAEVLEKIIREIFPPEYIRLVQGEGAVVVPDLLENFRFDHIFYTGGTVVGKAIYQSAAAKMIPVTLELGGKSPAVIGRDADIRITARRIAIGKFTNAGQTCVAPDYLLVHTSVKEPLMQALKETIGEFYGKDPAASYNYGRINNGRHFDRLAAWLSQGEIILGGQQDRSSLYIAPTIMENIQAGSSILTTEIFGPLLPVFTYGEMEEALAVIRRNPDPLAFYLFTRDGAEERKWIEAVRFGGGCVNNTLWHVANHHMPFGGIGNSGIGAYHGKYSFDLFSHAKPVLKTPGWIDPDIKYPPFEGKGKWIRRLMK